MLTFDLKEVLRAEDGKEVKPKRESKENYSADFQDNFTMLDDRRTIVGAELSNS